MSSSSYSCSLRLVLLILSLAALLGSCVTRPFVPVNVGREYGNPTTPWVVSHLPEKNQWALARSKPHNFFQKIVCFNYPCRKMIGRRTTLRAISFKAFKKRIAKNAKRGAYKSIIPVPITKQKRDTIVIVKDTVRIASTKPVPGVKPPILKADSLITLSEFLFERDSYKLKEKHFSQLDSLSKFLLTHSVLEVSVSGHTDNTGNERHNVTLSAQRAEVVAQYLINKGVSDEKILFEGYGSSRPVSGNETEEGRGKNRRVEILIRDPKKN
ncbi:MAG: OmpA family protein [Bacteroidetes bacterium]|nr:OmpA family protein [Bacteroidota bacterium]